jgi:hypothetical protein
MVLHGEIAVELKNDSLTLDSRSILSGVPKERKIIGRRFIAGESGIKHIFESRRDA